MQTTASTVEVQTMGMDVFSPIPRTIPRNSTNMAMENPIRMERCTVYGVERYWTNQVDMDVCSHLMVSISYS